MDDAIVSPNTPMRLRRTSESNRLEKQFLINAYECLVALITPDEQHHAKDQTYSMKGERNREYAYSSEAREVFGIGEG